jgi:hypothetical protein
MARPLGIVLGELANANLSTIEFKTQIKICIRLSSHPSNAESIKRGEDVDIALLLHFS